MKKIFVYASVIGLVVGIVYWLGKKGKTNYYVVEMVGKKRGAGARTQEKDFNQNTNEILEMYQTKKESVKWVSERHAEATSIMKDAYDNIMDVLVEDFSGEKDVESKDNKEVIIDESSVSVMKAIDLTSDKLDDLLK